jgi:hypothetical protein
VPTRHRRERPGLWAGVAVVLAGVSWLTGCAAAPAATDTASTPALPAGVTVELVQLRADVAPRQAQVRVINDSDEAITIGEIRVEDPRFDGAATRVVGGRTSTVPAGRSVDVRVQLPQVDCAAPADARSEVVLELLSDAGAADVAASAGDPLGFVAPLHARECRLARLADAASVDFTAFRPSAPGAPATLELTITPSGEGAASLVGVQRTNLIDFAAPTVDGAYPLDLAIAPGDTQPIVVAIPIVPVRCDPHAVQEDKRGTIFDVRVEVDGQPGEIELFVGEEMRGAILSWVPVWCGAGG